MPKVLIFLCLLALIQPSIAQPLLNLMSFNIRLNVASDGENAWPHRKEMVESTIRFHQADLIGIQEALPDQMEDLKRLLPDYAHIGMARDTGKWGEYSAIFYRRSRLEVQASGTFWLSDEPEKKSLGWDAALPRIVTWGRFRDKRSQVIFYHFNTHFDHKGVQAREESAHLILREIAKIQPHIPVLLSGDFNFVPSAPPYKLITDSTQNNPLRDAFLHAQRPAHGPASTWSGFKEAGVAERRIDYIFVNKAVSVLSFGSLTDSWSGAFPSDHLPIMARVLLKPVKVLPQAHAHNDYEHKRPLLDALDHGFISVEADVWLIEQELYLSHLYPTNHQKLPTLKEAYLEPLARRAQLYEGRIYPDYTDPFYLMIDLKNKGNEAYEIIRNQLADYQWLLQGPQPIVKVFLSGDRPKILVLDLYNPIALDGRPEELGKGYSVEKMPVVSQRYSKVLKWSGNGPIPESEREKLKELVSLCHVEGKKLRLWASPEKEVVWEELLAAGVDFINTDALAAFRDFSNK